ncbi:MAG: hypothetical protein WD672_01795 [Woeseia sp.]
MSGFYRLSIALLLAMAGCQPSGNGEQATARDDSAPITEPRSAAADPAAASDPAVAADAQAVDDGILTDSAAAKADAFLSEHRSPGKPGGPITISYKVLGSAIVGQPVLIELEISSSITDRPIDVSYHIDDSASMLFPESQARRMEVRLARGDGPAERQVTVVPQREGRLYLNILAEVDTSDGMMIKTMSVPISVGAGAIEPEVNGELVEGPDGEVVISLPAEEN